MLSELPHWRVVSSGLDGATAITQADKDRSADFVHGDAGDVDSLYLPSIDN